MKRYKEIGKRPQLFFHRFLELFHAIHGLHPNVIHCILDGLSGNFIGDFRLPFKFSVALVVVFCKLRIACFTFFNVRL
ncbi:MAG: hypothetical protein NTZ74_09690 [Chloroflexi bacterium]|nr:hypothetical protein [Chloroflexota bacterium]